MSIWQIGARTGWRRRNGASPPLKLNFRPASVLDRSSIISRYPNGFASGKPGDYLSDQDALDSVCSSKIIIRFCNGILA
jgi:hypothetical protein